jgi:hypothetical protein
MPSAKRRTILQNLAPSIKKWEADSDGQDPVETAQDVLAVEQQLRFEVIGLGNARLTFVQGSGLAACGAVGNCMLWILDQTDKPILEGVSGKEFSILPSYHHGLPDILLGIHDSASQTDQIWFQYDGKQYRETKCATDTYGMPYADNKRHREFGPCYRK